MISRSVPTEHGGGVRPSSKRRRRLDCNRRGRAAGSRKQWNRWVTAGTSGATSHCARMANGSGSSAADVTDMNTWIRLALAASLSIPTAPAVMARCIVSQMPSAHLRRRYRFAAAHRPLHAAPHEDHPPPQPAPFRAIPIPSPRQAQTMGAPNTSLMPNTSLPGGL